LNETSWLALIFLIIATLYASVGQAGASGYLAAMGLFGMAPPAMRIIALALNLLVAALFGVFIPMLMVKFGRDPAVGSSVLITAITDSGGFFIFLGLATLFLLH